MTASLIGDTQHAAVKPVAAGLLAHIVTQADIEDTTSNLNDTAISGKVAGMAFIMKNTIGDSYSLVIAEGSAAADPWDTIVTGSIPLPIVTQADIEDKTADVNITATSGKAAGVMYRMKNTTGTTYDLVIAEGSTDVSPWDRVSDGGSAPITPA